MKMADEQIPAGWYPDPAGDVTKIRYWDGQGWTEQTQAAQNTGMQGSYNVPIAPQPIYAQGQQSPQYAGAQPGLNPAANSRDKFGVAALVLGIASIFCCCCISMFLGAFGAIVPGIMGVLGVVFGILGIKSNRKGMAIAGLVCGAITILLVIGLMVLYLAIMPDMIANPEAYGLPPDYFETMAEQLGLPSDYFEDVYR
jgi:hypothetical protein